MLDLADRFHFDPGARIALRRCVARLMATGPHTPLAFVPAPEFVERLRAAEGRLLSLLSEAGLELEPGEGLLTDTRDLLREAADRLERAEASRRRVMMGGGL
jgi:hypothetical protein